MASRTDPSEHWPLAVLLVAYRLPIYIGGLLVISIPLILSSAFNVVIPATARTVLVVVTLAVMIATYIAERYVGYDTGNEVQTDEDEESTYSLRLRVALAFSIIGIAAGIYIALEIAPFTGMMFIVGAYLFGYFGYRGEFDENDTNAEEV